MKQFSAEKQSLRDLFSEEAPEIIIPDCKRLDGACRALWELVRPLARPETGRECLLGAVVLCPSGPGRVEAVGGTAQLLASKLFLQALCEETSPENAVRDLSRALERTEEETPERRFFRDRLRELSAFDADLPARMAVPDRAVFLVVEAVSREEAFRAASALGLNAAQTVLSGLFTEGRLAALTEAAQLAFPGPFGAGNWSPLDELLTQYLEARAVEEGKSPDVVRLLEEDGAPERLEAFAEFWKRVRTPVRRFPAEVLLWLLIVEQLPEAVWTNLLSAWSLSHPGLTVGLGRFLEHAATFAWLCAVRYPEPGDFEQAVRRGAPALANWQLDVQNIDLAELRRRIFEPAFTGGPAARSILAWWAFRREDQPLALPGTALALARIGGEDKVGGGDRIGNLTLLEAPIAAAAEGRSFAEKRDIWLGVKEDGFVHPKTVIRELEEIAQRGDLTRAQAERRGGAIRTALFDVLQKAFFVAAAPALKSEKAVPSPEQEKAFRARWAAVAAAAAEAFPKTPAFGLCPPMEELLACFIYGELAMRGELKALPPGPKKFFGADPAGYFRKDEAALGTLEALADFWKRVSARDAGFSDAVQRQFFILGFAPNAVWTYLVSTWLLARRGKDGTLENEPLERFLRAVTAFVLGYSVMRPSVDSLKTAVLPAFAAIVRGRPVTFKGRGFLYNEVVSHLTVFDFCTNHSVRQAFLSWWTFRGEHQPLPAPGTMFDVEHLGFGEALGNTLLLERSLISTDPEASRPYAEKRRIWLGLAEGSVKTEVREVAELAATHEDFTPEDAAARTERIVEAFMEELGEAGLLTESPETLRSEAQAAEVKPTTAGLDGRGSGTLHLLSKSSSRQAPRRNFHVDKRWACGEFENRWTRLGAAAAEAFPKGLNRLLDCFRYGELALLGAIGSGGPPKKDLYGEAGPRAFFLTHKVLFEKLESLAVFWKRVRVLDEGFSPEVRRCLRILSFAPSAAWMHLLSAWFLAGTPSGEPPRRLLRAVADFMLGWALEHPDEASLSESVLSEVARISGNRLLSFSDVRFDPDRIRLSLRSRRFSRNDQLTVPLLAWWTFHRADQPLFAYGTEFKIENLSSADSPALGSLFLIEKYVHSEPSGSSFAARRPYYLGFKSGKKNFQKTRILELAELAAAHEDFTSEDEAARTERMIEAFLAELGEVGLLFQPDSPFGRRWTRLEAAAEKAFPKTPAYGLCPPMDELFACFVYGEAALRGEISELPGLKAFLGEDPTRYFEENESALETLEALADFWTRVEARDAAFSDSVRRRLFILGFAPNAVWTYLVSAYFLARRGEDGSLENEPLSRFLRVITAFILGFSVVHPGADALKAAVLPEFSEIVSGRPVSFVGRRFTRGELLASFASFDFTSQPVREALLGWWAFGEEQPLPASSTEFVVEHFALETEFLEPKSYEAPGNTSLVERSRRASGPYAVKRRHWFGTSVRDLDQTAWTYETFTEADAGARMKKIVDAFIEEIDRTGLLERIEEPGEASLRATGG